ncbi:MarR family winged helix-turn-helix transcriptional regulator [Clostridium sp. Cult2]|uniref:MarR family winged helix-turn-helix transcriptional regulator n=1 Tax=Clostridium sp. Cult2 TaxID=2079003 RepID=UPI001F0038C5|nr:MarR family transcriptional regulator [Clostridium sp. Cult2]MCF6466788.1 hypothetical protein [Clostridium sp. Cult2]
MELQKTSETISNYIRECSNIIHKKGHQIAQEYDLTYDQYHLLIYLSFCETPPTINEISNKFNRAQNTMSEKISRLEEKELVSRMDDIEDRRVTRVKITEKGLNLINVIRQERSNRVTYVALKKMKIDEIENLLTNLSKFYNNLKEEV